MKPRASVFDPSAEREREREREREGTLQVMIANSPNGRKHYAVKAIGAIQSKHTTKAPDYLHHRTQRVLLNHTHVFHFCLKNTTADTEPEGWRNRRAIRLTVCLSVSPR